MQLSNLRHLTAVVTTAILLTSAAAHADATSSFDDLRAELLSRANSLTGSVDKVEQKQGKACVKAIAAIDKSTTLANDIKTGGKIAKSLAKVFPDDFAPVLTTVSTNNLAALLADGFGDIMDSLEEALDEVQTAIDALPPGSAKTSAQATLDAAWSLLLGAEESSDFGYIAKSLGSTLKNLLKAIKTLDKANNSGGGGGGQGLSCTINGSPFSALGAAGSHVNITGQFTVFGATATKGVTIIAVNVFGPGTYPATGGTAVLDIPGAIQFASNLTGTIHVTTFNLAQQKASGTFTFSASQTTPTLNPSNTVEVLQGSFNISSITAF